MADVRRGTRLLVDAVRRDNPRKAAAAVALDVFVALTGSSLVGLWLKLIVDGATAGERRTVILGGLGLAFSLSLSGAVHMWSAALYQDLHESHSLVLMQDVMRHAAAVPGIEHHERPEYADRIALIRNDSRLFTNFLTTFGRALSFVVRVAVTGVLLASVHPILLVLPLLAIPSVWTGARSNRIVEKANEVTAELVRREDHLYAVAASPAWTKEARIYGLGPELVAWHRAAWDEVIAVVARAKLRAGLVRASGWLCFAAGYVGAIVLAVARASAGHASAGDVLLVIALVNDVSGHVGRIVSLANESAGIYRAVDRMLWLADYADAATTTTTGEPAPVLDRLVGGIELRDVEFTYPGTDAPVLSGVNLSLPAGSVVAVVGENGAGKTTLVKLLTRCYEPTSGQILVDGVDLRRLPVHEWRRRSAAAFQDFVRFQLVLREGVGTGDLDRIHDVTAVEAALARSQAGDLAPALPDGLETQLGKLLDGGTDLSEGQWQKVAIGRSFMRDAPLLLVLDEPTSGLDATAEHALFEHYAATAASAAAISGAVTVLISHRFSTVRLADLIVVVDDGRVVAAGTHDQLVGQPGLYADLYTLQAGAYR